jgi:putative DNA primase/helicase
MLGVPNGMVDLRTGELLPGESDKRVTMHAATSYDPQAACPLWEASVADIFKDDPDLIHFVHRALGYSMTGDCREEVFFLCVGGGRNGKGTIINTVAYVLKDYHDNLSFHSLERGSHGPKEASNDLAKLARKRFVTASETLGGRFDESRIKSLTGRDPVTARFLYQEEFTFTPELKLWLSVNNMPRVRDDSVGFWARPRVIPFNQCYDGRADKTLKERLREEAPGILAWLVRGCLAWQREGLGLPPAVSAAVEQYRQHEDFLSEFYEDCCVIGSSENGTGVRVRPMELFSAYLRWCDRMRIRVRLGSKGFSQRVARRFRRAQSHGMDYFLGVGLLDEGGEEL